MNIILSISTTLSLLALAYAIVYLRWVLGIYLAAIVFGFFQTGFLVASLELAIELTYPAPELITSSFLNIIPSVIGRIFVIIGSYVVDNFGSLASIGFYVITLLLGFICILCVKERLKRQEAIQMREAGRESNGAERQV